MQVIRSKPSHYAFEVKRIPDSDSRLLFSTEALLKAVPSLNFTPSTENKKCIWYDLEKLATPKGEKESLKYDSDYVHCLIVEELLFLLGIHNTIIKILLVVPVAFISQNLVAAILERVHSIDIIFGGGETDRVKRIKEICSALGVVQSPKRKVAEVENEKEGTLNEIVPGFLFDKLSDGITDSDIDDAIYILSNPFVLSKEKEKKIDDSTPLAPSAAGGKVEGSVSQCLARRILPDTRHDQAYIGSIEMSLFLDYKN